MTDTSPIPPLTAEEIEQAIAWLTEWAKPCGVSWSGKHAAVILSALAEKDRENQSLCTQLDGWVKRWDEAETAEINAKIRAEDAEAALAEKDRRIAELERERAEARDKGRDALAQRDHWHTLYGLALDDLAAEKARATSAEALSAAAVERERVLREALKQIQHILSYAAGWRLGERLRPIVDAALSSPAPGEAEPGERDTTLSARALVRYCIANGYDRFTWKLRGAIEDDGSLSDWRIECGPLANPSTPSSPAAGSEEKEHG